MAKQTYDVVIVGAGIAGGIVALELAKTGRSVLILESGPETPPTERQGYLETFFTNSTKTPSSPYPPSLFSNPAQEAVPRATVADTFASNVEPGFPGNLSDPDGYIYNPKASYLLQKGPHPFASTYERIFGGTTWHWLGTSLRFLEHDFTMQTTYGVETDWPSKIFKDLVDTYYNKAESLIGVSANKTVQEDELGPIGLEYSPSGYKYPMQGIPLSLVDEAVQDGVRGTGFENQTLVVTPTPQGRNSQPRGQRRTCAGNTNCIPICPIQAKYDATVTLSAALQFPGVKLVSQAVASRVNLNANGDISGIDYISWTRDASGKVEQTGTGTAVGTVYVLAAHAIETPKLLLVSASNQMPGGVANSSGLVGCNLMDHPLYLSWSQTPNEKPIWGYRGPLSTSGIEVLRDGPFRSNRAAWRVEIGNEGWNFSIGDPWTTTTDFITGSNASQLNPNSAELFGDQLVAQLNSDFIRQWRLGFLVEQTPDASNRVTLSDSFTDALGLPRPEIHYTLSDYTKLGFVAAEIFSRQIYLQMGARNYTQNPQKLPVFDNTGAVVRTVNNPNWFPLDSAWRSQFENLPPELKDPKVSNLPTSANGVPEGFQYFGSGHIVGTCVMGSAAGSSVVDPQQRSWDHKNLYIVGSSVFPTITTANPTLTIAALAFQAADTIRARFG